MITLERERETERERDDASLVTHTKLIPTEKEEKKHSILILATSSSHLEESVAKLVHVLGACFVYSSISIFPILVSSATTLIVTHTHTIVIYICMYICICIPTHSPPTANTLWCQSKKQLL